MLGSPLLLWLALAGMALVLWALVDLSSYSMAAWQKVGRNRTVWVVVLIVATFLVGFGWLVAIFYLVWLRPKLRAADGR
jgi:hypothetical protein